MRGLMYEIESSLHQNERGEIKECKNKDYSVGSSDIMQRE